MPRRLVLNLDPNPDISAHEFGTRQDRPARPFLADQLDLFAPKPRNFDEAKLIARLREAEVARTPPGPFRMSRAALKRLMTPLPPITVPK